MKRDKYSEETLKKIKEIREAADGWIYKKKYEEDKMKDKKAMKQILNKLTLDNFDVLSKDLLNFAKNKILVDNLIDMLI